MSDHVPVTPRPAASLVLIRDGEPRRDGRRLQVLLTERNGGMPVAGGAFVFPGGKVALEDGEGEAAYRFAAIREAFEEAGVILARDVGLEVQDRVMARYKATPAPVDFWAVLRAEGVEHLMEDLIPFAHWITPEVRAHRFDTRFYLAVMPEGQMVRQDGIEAVSTLWTAPDEMIELFGHDSDLLMFPTRMSLGVLAQAGDVAEALELVKSRAVVPVMPLLEKRPDGIYAHVPEGAGFGGSFFRFQLKDRVPGQLMIEPVRE
ncbi:NUDIX hydrolase [Govanella unica]|uniref:NUDIX domain-containing protein n=1 Tax=Govanella unica TaxID=2975056 RepID=A0A9X3TXY7_9PROT|nr:NUDIX domain-containing protein [Govania unica]MDA5193765.1 NUDIX domain-containing protein [Govania unica]